MFSGPRVPSLQPPGFDCLGSGPTLKMLLSGREKPQQWPAPLGVGAAFKLRLSPSISVWTMLQVCLCPVLCLPDSNPEPNLLMWFCDFLAWPRTCLITMALSDLLDSWLNPMTAARAARLCSSCVAPALPPLPASGSPARVLPALAASWQL